MKNLLKSKKIISFLTTISLALTLLTGIPLMAYAQENSKNFDIIEITDFHGALNDSSGNPVAAVLSDRLNEIKESNHDRTLILGGGDLYQGSATSNIMKGIPVQEVMTEMGMEVTTLGNHEFDWGLDTIINTTMKGAGYSIVCSNLYDKRTGKRVFEPYKIITKDGIKIAIIGGITTETPSIVLPEYVKDYDFRDLTSEVNSVAQEIKQNNLADVTLVLVHEGDNRDNATGPIFEMANQLKNVDAVFGGHTHTKVCGSATNTKIPVYIAKSYGKGYIDVKFAITDDKKVKFESPSCDKNYVALDNENGYKSSNPKQDANVDKIVKMANEKTDPMTSELIGLNTDRELTRTQGAYPYGSSVLGNWASDITRSSAGAQVGFQNNGGLRIDIPTGDITVGSMWKFMPFDNTVYKLNMKKADIKAVLEQAVCDEGKGLQISGINFTYDSTLPSGNRVINITKEDGSEMSDTEVLTAGVPDFLATGGDGFTAFRKCGGSDPSNDTHIIIRDAFINWCKTNKDKNGENTIPNSSISRMTNVSSTISILATTDVHGSVLNYDYATGKAPKKGQGLAKISSYVKSVRASNKNVMLIDNGDAIQGTPLVYYYNLIDTNSEYPMAKVMGAMKYDSCTLGNHEFNYGLKVLNRVVKDYQKEGITVLGANIYNTASATKDSKEDTNFVQPYIMKSFNVKGKEIKVAVIGLENKCIPNWEDAAHYKGLYFNDLVDEAKKWVKVVKDEGADIVVVSAHSGQESESDVIPENQINAIVTQVSGIDAIVAGHAHKKVNDLTQKNPEGKVVPIIESTKFATGVAHFDMNLDSKGNLIGISTKNVIMNDSIKEDPEIVKLIKPYNDTTLKYVQTKVGTSTGEFSGKGQTTGTTPIMELINKVQKESADAQLSIAAPLSASCFIPQGDVSIKDMMSVYVFENFLYGVKMNGQQLKDWMEYSVKYYAQTNNENQSIIKDPVLNIPDYNLDQLYGATYDIDLTEPACKVDAKTGRVISGNRIKNLKVNGVEVQDSDEFTVAINNYRFNGGGGFMKAAGLDNTDSSIVTYDSAKALGDDGQIRSLMTEYFKKKGEVSPDCSNNWKIITKDVVEREAA